MLQIIVLQRTFEQECLCQRHTIANSFQMIRISQFRCRNCVNYFRFVIENGGVRPSKLLYSRLAISQWHCRSGEIYCAHRSRTMLDCILWWMCDQSCSIHILLAPISSTLRTYRSQSASQPFTLHFVATTTSFHAQRLHLRRRAYVHCGSIDGRIPVSRLAIWNRILLW